MKNALVELTSRYGYRYYITRNEELVEELGDGETMMTIEEAQEIKDCYQLGDGEKITIEVID